MSDDVRRCLDCGRPLYTYDTPPPDRPAGSVKHAGHGLCARDRDRRQRSARREADQPAERLVWDKLVRPRPPADLRQARAALDGYMRERARRLAENDQHAA